LFDKKILRSQDYFIKQFLQKKLEESLRDSKVVAHPCKKIMAVTTALTSLANECKKLIGDKSLRDSKVVASNILVEADITYYKNEC